MYRRQHSQGLCNVEEGDVELGNRPQKDQPKPQDKPGRILEEAHPSAHKLPGREQKHDYAENGCGDLVGLQFRLDLPCRLACEGFRFCFPGWVQVSPEALLLSIGF